MWNIPLIPLLNTTVAYSDRIDLPSSAVDGLASLMENREPGDPLTFKITNHANGNMIHAGVREFSAEDGYVMLPEMLFAALGLDSSGSGQVSVQLVELPKAEFIRLKPLVNDSTIDDWKALLESQLRQSFTTLTKGSTLVLPHPYENKTIQLLVEDTKPSDAVCIVDADVVLDLVSIENSQDVENKPSSLSEWAVYGEDALLSERPIAISSWKRDAPLQITWNVDRFDSASRMVFVGPTKGAFIWSSFDGNLIIPQNSPYLEESLFIYSQTANNEPLEVSLGASRDVADAADASEPACPNCHQHVPAASMAMHSLTCARNNLACDACGTVFRKRDGIPANHWHCELCRSTVSGVGELSRELHNRVLHSAVACSCGEKFSDSVALGFHRSTTCRERLVICKFCHLLVPQDDRDASAALQGLTGHEARCGSRTADCEVCRKPVMLRNLAAHMELHDMQRRTRGAPEACCNVNCMRALTAADAANNKMRLCSQCFGPIYSTAYDPTGAKLKSRIERRYVIQMTRGCGRSWCTNALCLTGSGQKRDMSEVLELTKSALEHPRHSFCVDAATTRRKLFIDFESSRGIYSAAWCAKAIQEAQSEAAAEKWLELNAVKTNEVQV